MAFSIGKVARLRRMGDRDRAVVYTAPFHIALRHGRLYPHTHAKSGMSNAMAASRHGFQTNAPPRLWTAIAPVTIACVTWLILALTPFSVSATRRRRWIYGWTVSGGGVYAELTYT